MRWVGHGRPRVMVEGIAEEPVRGLEGVIDLVFEEADGLVVVDYETDVGADSPFEERPAGYRRRGEQYADAWYALTGGRMKERVLFTARGGVGPW